MEGATGVEVPCYESLLGNSWFIKIEMKQIYYS